MTNQPTAPLRHNVRMMLVMVHDLGMTGATLLLCSFIRFGAAGFFERAHDLSALLVLFLPLAAVVFWTFGLYRAKWRFASLPDLFNIFRSVSLLALILLVIDYLLVSSTFYGSLLFGKITIGLFWCLLIFALGGPRISYRYYRFWRTRARALKEGQIPILAVGRAEDAEVLLRAIESGAARHIGVLGIVSPALSDIGLTIRGVRVLGAVENLDRVINDLEQGGLRLSRVLLLPSAFTNSETQESLLGALGRHGLTPVRMPSLDQTRPFNTNEGLRLAPIAIEDLMQRSNIEIDHHRLAKFAQGRSVLVTGGGGSIGSELCERIVTYGAKRLLILEHAEPALHLIMERLAPWQGSTIIEGRICDIRERAKLHTLMAGFKPDVVFHAAALKHVPITENDWDEALKTNVIGSVNVADAAIACGTEAMVMISTDKAIEPVSILGASKRLAEIYCQSLDASLLKAAKGKDTTRLVVVRFGNVLSSSGSVIPIFRRQIEAGGPVTVTDPDMVRYFMTTREACDLVLSAATHGLSKKDKSVSTYVLDMGQPVRIQDLAERMIRIAGLEPMRDIDIVHTGIRPGEKLVEPACVGEIDVGLPGIFGAAASPPPIKDVRALLVRLEAAIDSADKAAAYEALTSIIRDFKPQGRRTFPKTSA